MTCVDGRGRQIVFRDITGNDLEFLDTILSEESKTLNSDQVIEILESICVTTGAKFSRLTPRALRSVYNQVSEHILFNYIPKELWLRQCYAIQNGSFQNLAEMEKVPMSKFIGMCSIHKEAMDQINNPTTPSPHGFSQPE